MKGRAWRAHGALPNADRVMHSTFWIGLYPGLTEAHLSFACETIKGFFDGYRGGR